MKAIVNIINDLVYVTEKPLQFPVMDLEEVAENYSKKVNGDYYDELFPNSEQTIGEISANDFKQGYNHAKQTLYSESDIEIAFMAGWEHNGKVDNFSQARKDWIKNYANKK